MKSFTSYYNPNEDNLELSYNRSTKGHTTTWDLTLQEAKNLKETQEQES